MNMNLPCSLMGRHSTCVQILFELLVIAFGPAASVRAFAWGRTKAGLTSFSCTTIREHLPLGGTSYKVHPKKQSDLIGVLDNEIFHHMKRMFLYSGKRERQVWRTAKARVILNHCPVGFKSENVNDGFSISKLGLNERPFRDLKASLRQNPAP